MLLAATTMFVVSAQTASAQEEESCCSKPHVAGVVSNKFWSNWELQLGVGPTFALRTKSGSIGNVTHFAMYGAAVKWFHPVFGVRVALEGGWHAYKDALSGDKQRHSFIYGHPDFMINLSNWIGGYKERVYNADIFAGGGLYVTNVRWGGQRQFGFGGEVGLQNRFNLGKKKAVSIDLTVEYVIARNEMYTQCLAETHAQALHVYAGLTYRFNKRGFDRNGASEEEAKAMLARAEGAEKNAADTEKENEQLKKDLAAAQVNPVTVGETPVVPETKARPQAGSAKEAVETGNCEGVNFYSYGIGTLSANDKSRLNVLANRIKNDDSGKTYVIEGFADPNTGSQKCNEKLADKRAKEVYNYLLKQGVDKDRVTYRGCGTKNLPFNSDEENRVSVIY